MISVDRATRIGVGLGLTFLSISGLMCINTKCAAEDTTKCIAEDTTKCRWDTTKCTNKKCSRVNMNLGLGSFCVAGGLMVYKNILNF
jgi:hypothetical protein